MFWILYRVPATKTMELFETDGRAKGFHMLRHVVLTPGTELLDFSGNLDGALDGLLAGVTLTDVVTETAV